MKIPDIGIFIEDSRAALLDMLEHLKNVKTLDTTDLDKEKTALIIIDMVNGFAKKGNLSSPRVEAIIPNVRRTAQISREREFKLLAFADCHCKGCEEFSSYPEHCLSGTKESELIDELKDIIGIEIIKKNSTNGFIEDEFKKWLNNNGDIDTFIIVGDCTDICVMQFSLSLKTFFNKNNKPVKIFIPLDSVDTFDLGIHRGDFMNISSLFIMEANGAEIVSQIR